LSATRSQGSSDVGARPTADRFVFRFLQRGFECPACRPGRPRGGGRYDHARVKIDRMFGLVARCVEPVLHLGDLGVQIGLARPILVRQLLAFALAVEPDQVVDRLASRRRSRWPSASASRDSSRHCRDARSFAARRCSIVDPSTQSARPSPTALGDELQDERKHVLMNFMRRRLRVIRQPGMIRNLVALAKPQEISQRSGVRAAPDNAAFTVEPFEIADHMHAK